MTITYRNGKSVRAILLSRSENSLRAMAVGEDDASEFKCVNGAWISEECEAVTIEFEWQRQKPESVPTEADCICSKELAAELIRQLRHPEPGESEDDQAIFANDRSLPVITTIQ